VLEFLLASYVFCINLTIPNPYTVYNLPEEQCMAIYEYAQNKCYPNPWEMLLCEQESEDCDFDKIVKFEEVCNNESYPIPER